MGKGQELYKRLQRTGTQDLQQCQRGRLPDQCTGYEGALSDKDHLCT